MCKIDALELAGSLGMAEVGWVEVVLYRSEETGQGTPLPFPPPPTLWRPRHFGHWARAVAAGHGSNVFGIETTAVYDASTQEFVINTGSNEASKFWIGGTGATANISAVFAQLTVNGRWGGRARGQGGAGVGRAGRRPRRHRQHVRRLRPADRERQVGGQ